MTNKGLIDDKDLALIKSAHPGTQLLKWKSKNGKDEIIFTQISQDLVKKITGMIQESELSGRPLPIEDVNNKIFDTCVLWPSLTKEEKDALPAGLVPNIVKTIQEKSGFLDVDIFGRILAPDVYTSLVQDFEYWGDISEEDAKKVIEKNKPHSLFRVRISKFVFIIRPLTRIDIHVATQANDSELGLAKCVTVWPEEVAWETIPAGVVELLTRKANEVSGWDMEAEVEEL